MPRDSSMNVATPKKQANTFSPPPRKKKKKNSRAATAGTVLHWMAGFCENALLVFVCEAKRSWTQR